jgi:hypothetical protein
MIYPSWVIQLLNKKDVLSNSKKYAALKLKKIPEQIVMHCLATGIHHAKRRN